MTHLVAHIDVMPTLAAAAASQSKATEIDGVNYIAFGNESGRPKLGSRNAVLAEWALSGSASRGLEATG